MGYRVRQGRKTRLIEINCTSLPEQIIESELFGHEKGAFTDAKNTKKGLFEPGDKGTVFLDEIGDMPMPAQAKLLGFLEKKQAAGISRLSLNRRLERLKIRDPGLPKSSRSQDQALGIAFLP